MTQANRPEPVQPDQRVELIDILRGFALTGVLLVNMMNYGGHWARWTGPLDTAFHAVEVFFFEQRFWHLFSILFGLGFAIQLLRADAKGVKHVPVYLRRLAILFGFGAFTDIFWGVDILTEYAILGVLLLPVRRWSPTAVLVLALLVQIAPAIQGPSQTYVHEIRMTDTEYAEAFEETRQREAEQAQRRTRELSELAANGSFGDVVAWRAHRYLSEFPPSLYLHPGSESGWGFFSMFLVGLYAGKRRILQEYAKHRRFMKKVGWIGLIVGVVGMSLTVWEGLFVDQPFQWSIALQMLFDTTTILGFTGMTFFYAYALSEWCLTKRLRFLQRGFAAVGRTALSNYLLQNMAMNVIFFAWGFGLHGQLGPAKTMLLSVPVYLVLMLLSMWWIRRFRFGPFEWLWRTLTYARFQPMRAPPSASTVS